MKQHEDDPACDTFLMDCSPEIISQLIADLELAIDALVKIDGIRFGSDPMPVLGVCDLAQTALSKIKTITEIVVHELLTEHAVSSAGADETPYEQFARAGYAEGYEKGVAHGRRQILEELCKFTAGQVVETDRLSRGQSAGLRADQASVYRTGVSGGVGERREAEQVSQQDNGRGWNSVPVGQGSADLGTEKVGT